MITIKNILLATIIVSMSLSHSVVAKMTKKDADKLEAGLMLGGTVIGSVVEATAVWKYASRSPSTSKARIPLQLLTASIAGIGGGMVGIAVGEITSDVITERLMRENASASELLMPHDENHPQKTEEIVIEKS
jgi:hypothetical protein